MGSIGETLRNAREAKGITLAQAEEDTKIRKRYLEALEQEDFDVIPGLVYARGFLRNYAAYLGLDQDEILMEFKLLSTPVREEHQKVDIAASINRRRAAGRSERRAYLVTAVIAILAIATLAVYNFWYKNSTGNNSSSNSRPPVAQQGVNENRQEENTAGAAYRNNPSQPAEDNTPETTGQAAGTQAGANGSAPGAPAAPGTVTNPADVSAPDTAGVNQSGVKITLNGKTQQCWARVIVDGTVQFTGFINPGETKTFAGTGKIIITLGNAGAVEVVENGRSLGTLGAIGQVVKNREFSAAPAVQGEVAP